MLELLAGVLVALAALVLVLEPLFSRRAARAAGSSVRYVEVVEIEESESPKVQALLALREVEFDRETGKLSEEDYLQLKAKYSALALAAIEEEEGAAATSWEHAAEAAISSARGRSIEECPTCGPRPESDAVFCSSCGRPLNEVAGLPRCPGCGGSIPQNAKFCAECGTTVAA